MFTVGKALFVVAALVAFAAFMRFMVYGLSSDFSWGFLAGALSFGLIVLAGMQVEMKDQLAKQRAELLAGLHRPRAE